MFDKSSKFLNPRDIENSGSNSKQFINNFKFKIEDSNLESGSLNIDQSNPQFNNSPFINSKYYTSAQRHGLQESVLNGTKSSFGIGRTESVTRLKKEKSEYLKMRLTN